MTVGLDFRFIVLTLLGAALLGWWALHQLTTEFGVTNKRLVMKTGILRRDVQEMSLAQIESVDVDQNVLGRLVGYGTITVNGTGTNQIVCDTIEAPLRFKHAIHEQIDQRENWRERAISPS